jgi:hypothetical protein
VQKAIASGSLGSVISEAAQCVHSSLSVSWFALFLLVCSFRTKIRNLRVPDTLLDAVKEEQARAREAGRGARGALVGGAGGVVGNRGVCSCISSA